jgi:hypothetical protein
LFKLTPCSAKQKLLLASFGQVHFLDGVIFFQYRRFARLQHTFQPPEQGKGQDNPPILALFEIAAQEIGQRPDIGRQIGCPLIPFLFT